MAQKLETDIVLNLAGNLAAKARQFGNSMGEFARKNKKAMSLIKSSTAAAQRGIDSLGNRYVGMATAFVTGATVKGFVSLDRRLSRLAIAADISKEKASDLYDTIQKVSNSEGIRIDSSESLSAIEEIITKTGDLQYAMDNLPNIATVIQATGAAGQQVGGIFTEFKKLAIEGQEVTIQAIDTLNKQGKSGAFTLASLANFGPQLFAAYASTGRQGIEAVTELGAALQVIRGGVGSDEQAVTAFEAIIRDITSPDRVKKLKELGNIDVFDPEKLKEGIEVMRPLPVLMDEIITRSGGLSQNLALLSLTDEAKRALNTLTSEFKQTGDVQSFEKFMQITGDGSVTMADASVAAGDAAASVQYLTNSINQFANQRLADPIRELADAINSLDDESIQKWLEWGEAAAWAVGGVVAASKGIQAVNAITRFLGVGKDGNGGKGGFQDLGATPVFVVNMPASGIGGVGGDISTESGSKSGKPSKASKVGAALKGAAAATIIYPVVDSVLDALIGTTDFGKWAKATTLGDLFSSDSSATVTESKVNAYLGLSSGSNYQQPIGYGAYDAANGTVKVEVGVSDDRITKRVTSSSPSIQIDPDTGIN
ncbi:TPA: phage tail tape measure protein [Vibrio parahaemolyticus]